MNSCLGVIVLCFLLVAVLGVGGTIFYLSQTTEFSRTDVAKEAPAE